MRILCITTPSEAHPIETTTIHQDPPGGSPAPDINSASVGTRPLQVGFRVKMGFAWIGSFIREGIPIIQRSCTEGFDFFQAKRVLGAFPGFQEGFLVTRIGIPR